MSNKHPIRLFATLNPACDSVGAAIVFRGSFLPVSITIDADRDTVFEYVKTDGPKKILQNLTIPADLVGETSGYTHECYKKAGAFDASKNFFLGEWIMLGLGDTAVFMGSKEDVNH